MRAIFMIIILSVILSHVPKSLGPAIHAIRFGNNDQQADKRIHELIRKMNLD